ncbi:hypothetical protein [Kouleothrix sp.]|uniref:hypothetical protein n=1 Tax=Kouleothrix sp. TaxID=2779161 RepID=UPI0039194A16
MTSLHDAAFQEQAIAQWHDWRRFLTQHLRLVELRMAAPGDEAAFELADSAAEREHDIKAQLAAIPADARALFGQALDERRQQVQATLDAERRAAGDPRGRPLDADEVERRALASLLDEAEGAEAQGVGQVPLADGWYDVDAARLGDVPDAAHYRLAKSKRLPPARIAMIAGVLLVSALALWLTRPGRASQATATASVMVNGQPAEPWAPRAIELLGARPGTLQVAPPGADAPPDRARWQPGAWPLRLCAPEAALAGVTAVRVLGGADVPARSYILTDTAGLAADLLLGPCDGATPARTGLLQSAEPPRALALGQAGELAEGTSVTLRALELVGPGEDPALPPGKAAVIAHAEASANVDWSRLSATLRWPDGSDILPSAVSPEAGGAALRYLVPLPDAPLAAVQWRVNSPAGAYLAWQAPLGLPPARAQLLAEALADVQARAERGPADAVRVSLAIENGARAELALAASDLRASAGGQSVPLPPLEALRTPLAPSERREIAFELALPPGQPLVLAVGPFSFEIRE